MGCKCSQSTNEQVINLENLIASTESGPVSALALTEYTKTMFKLINGIRKNPAEFANLVEKAVAYITKENNRLIFNYKLKVALNRGEEAFKGAADELRSITSMNPLEFKDDIVIETPTDENELKDMKIFMDKVILKKKKYNLEAYFKDAVKDPEVAIMMIIVDDSTKNAGKKRASILNSEFRYIGISSCLQGNTFCAYYTLSK